VSGTQHVPNLVAVESLTPTGQTLNITVSTALVCRYKSPVKIFSCAGGDIVLPDSRIVLVSREDGGNLVIDPPREVSDRTDLTPEELTLWTFLISATAKAMFDVLPQLEEGCMNYWDAGNWSLNDEAEPVGRKSGAIYRKTHMHLLGRSPNAKSESWRWGEAPRFPDYAQRFDWCAKCERLTPGECRAIVARAEEILLTEFSFAHEDIAPWTTCERCDYPTPGRDHALCEECA
jgi:hypothetical protein